MVFVQIMVRHMERAGFEMHLPFFRPLMTALNAPLTAVGERMEKIDHMLCRYRNFFC